MLKHHYKKLHRNKYIVKLSDMVNAEDLWSFNRRSVAKALALGVACSWIPLPFHTTIAVFLAVLIDCNIPLVIVSIWFANPLTMPFMYYFAYKIGEYLLNVHIHNLNFHLSIPDMLEALHEIWQPFLLGCSIAGVVSGLIVYFTILLIWPNIHHRFNERSAHKKH